jgi:bifunctional DNA-binding transcriptional regulator/antitoxin component of YhaV-PrlF toxin-antitoxin module
MSVPQSKVTATGHVLVPVEIRKMLGIGPGSVLEWHERKGGVLVRRSGRFNSADIHRALFPEGAPKRAGASDVKKDIQAAIQKKHARR